MQAARQMVETGDIVDIRFRDEPRWKKPAGIYWLQAGAVKLWGEDRAPAFVHRAPSALGALAASLFAFWGFSALIGRRRAFLAALVTASAALTVAEAHIAKTDAVLLAFVMLAMACLARLWPLPLGRLERVLFWAALGFGFLVKGPVILLPTAGVLLALCLFDRSLRPLGVVSWRTGPLVFLAIVLPWVAAIWLRTEGAFFDEAVGRDLLGKLTEGQEKHWGPPGYYLLAVWAVFWPWAPLLLHAAPEAWRGRDRPQMRFLIGWILPAWIVFEATATKLPHYILPLLPALAALVAVWLAEEAAADRFAADRFDRPRWRRILAAGLFGLVGFALALAAIAGPPLIEGRLVAGAALLGLAGAGAVALGARALAESDGRAFTAFALVSALLLYPAVLHFALPSLATAFPSPRMAAAEATWRACSGQPGATTTYREPSYVFASGRDALFLNFDEAAALLAERRGAAVWVEDRFADRLAERRPGMPELRELARIEAFNYNRGKPTTLRLLADAADPVIAACPGG